MRVVACAAAVAISIALAAATNPSPAAGAGPRAEQPRAAGSATWEKPVRDLLDARAAAVLARDREAFLATVDPAATETFRDAQRTLFTGLATVPFDVYSLELRADEISDLRAAVLDDRDRADEIRLPLVEERLRVSGVDSADLVNDLWYTFVRRGDRWYVNEDNDLGDLGLLTQRMLWSYGPVVLTQGENVVVMSRPDDVGRAEALLAITEEGYGRLRRTLDWPAPPRVLVTLPESTDQLEDILQTTFDLTNFVAFATADVERGADVGGWRWTAPRVYAQEANLARHGRDFQVETLHHELFHALGFEQAGPFITNWIHEGTAEYEALGHPAPSSVPGTDGKLPLDHEFVTGGRDRILRAYRESTSAVAFLADKAGEDAPKRLFEALGALRLVPGTWEYHLDQALGRIYGKGTALFEEDWSGGR